MRVEHAAQRAGFRQQEGAAIVHHAAKIRNIDIDERRDLQALDERRSSLMGRAVGLVRGSGHYDRQERAIVDRHEQARWNQHRDHEGRKERLFVTEQAARLRQAGERHGIAERHRDERRDLAAAQTQARPKLVEARVAALAHANENQLPRQQGRSNTRPVDPFNQASGRTR